MSVSSSGAGWRSKKRADAQEVEARCPVFYSLWIGSHFIAADHIGASRADVVKLALNRLGA